MRGAVDIGEVLARPGMDPRQWISYGLVEADAGDVHSVMFDDDDGTPIAMGPRVMVTLQPSNITVPCRVSNMVAGVGEGGWVPFGPKDEVLVAVPEGDERSGCVIIGRLNNELDTWPRVVAGMDATKNTFGFWRLRTPFVIETAASFLIRSALTTAQIGIDPDGQVILADGDQNHLMFSTAGFSMANKAQDIMVQADYDGRTATLAAGTARLDLADGQKDSQLFTAGMLKLIGGGAGATGHAVTIEQVLNVLMNYTCVLAQLGWFAGTGPAPGVWNVDPYATTQLNTILSALLPATVSPTPIGTLGAPGGNLAQLAPGLQLLGVALANPLPAQDPTGFLPGIGRAAVML